MHKIFCYYLTRQGFPPATKVAVQITWLNPVLFVENIYGQGSVASSLNIHQIAHFSNALRVYYSGWRNYIMRKWLSYSHQIRVIGARNKSYPWSISGTAVGMTFTEAKKYDTWYVCEMKWRVPVLRSDFCLALQMDFALANAVILHFSGWSNKLTKYVYLHPCSSIAIKRIYNIML